MKRIIFWVVLIVLLASVSISANSPLFLIKEQSRNQIDVVGTDYRPVNTLNTDSKPIKIVDLPDNQGYAVLNEGSGSLLGAVKTNASIQLLDPKLTKLTTEFSFSGIVNSELLLQDSMQWIIVTTEKKDSSTINIVNLVTKDHFKYNLTSLPVDFQLSPDQSKLAVITVSGSEENPQSQVTVIDLTTEKNQTFKVSHNPGAVFFTGNDQILVACGGYRESMKYSLKTILQKTNKATPAQIHLINLNSAEISDYQVGFSPLVILQDPNNSEKFYLASVNEPYAQQASGTFRVFENGTINTEIPIKTEPTKLIATPTGNIALFGRVDFYLINPETKSTLTELKLNLKPEELRINHSGEIGYLSVVNSSVIREINLINGSYNEIKLGTNLFGMLNLVNLLPTTYPPVISMKSNESQSKGQTTVNYRTFLSNDSSKLYSISGLKEISVTDLTTKKTINKINFKGNAFGIYPDPNGKYVIVATNKYWHLIDPTKKKADFSILVNEKDDELFSRTGYISPDGTIMVISAERYLFVVDLVNAKQIAKIKIKNREPLIIWP